MRGSEAPARVRIGAARGEITKQFVVGAGDRAELARAVGPGAFTALCDR
jgi:hypothetical protein